MEQKNLDVYTRICNTYAPYNALEYQRKNSYVYQKKQMHDVYQENNHKTMVHYNWQG